MANQLKTIGFSTDDISVLVPEDSAVRTIVHEKSTKAPEGVTAGVSAGGVLGGTLGLLAGIGALAIPGLGPLIAAGPLMAALSGAAVGATVGGIGGALVGMGIPEIEAKQCEGKVRSGSILLSVHTEDAKELHRAKDVLSGNGAEDIASTSEVKAS